MIKRFWRWLYGNPEPDKSLALMELMVENQEKSTRLLMNAVAQIGEASQKQAEVLNSYLKLFQGAGEPQAYPRDEEAENLLSMTKLGFDPKWPEAQQAEWVLANIDRI